MTKLPETVDALVNALDKAFPLINFPVTTPAHVIQRELGKRDVVDYLRSLQRDRDDRVAESFGGTGSR